MAKVLEEVEESLFYEVHCKKCGCRLGYFMSFATEESNDLHIMSAECFVCATGAGKPR